MKTAKIIYSMLIMLPLFFGCENMDEHKPIEKSGKAPNPVDNIEVTNIAGGAVITYSLPKDPDLLYVMASYTEKGSHREFKASYYTNTILVDGLSREGEYDVELVAVNRSGLKSEVKLIQIHPLTPPVMGVFATLKGKPTFGGITISFENSTQAAVAVGVLTTDEDGVFYERDTYYSSRPAPSFSVRGFDSKERVFKVFVRDKWENTSDTTSFTVIPLEEIELDKSLFREMKLKGDAGTTEWGGQMRYIWDGRAFGDDEGEWGLHTGNLATGKPMYVTFDLGVIANLSRFKLWPVMDDKHMYNDVTPRNYEIWGRTVPVNITTDDGEFYPHWYKMGELECIKPSGLPAGSLTDEDRAAARIGDEFVFEDEQFNARYIRIRCLKNWSGNTNMVFSEVSFWATEIKSIAQ
ncbi:MAG: DUF4959 domain-containing protein [Candidatus Symbiothrix sp.]|jgi:hypothetical protein|nr:DUF4959 domain-containing protein [Candidatus Symbiothrix sp.]